MLRDYKYFSLHSLSANTSEPDQAPSGITSGGTPAIRYAFAGMDAGSLNSQNSQGSSQIFSAAISRTGGA